MTAVHTPIRDWDDGASIDSVVLVREVERREKRDGSPFLRLVLGDRSGTVPAVVWDPAREGGDAASPGTPVHVVGRCADHSRYGRQLTITALDAPADADVAWDELLAGPVRAPAVLETELDGLLDSIEQPHLSQLLGRLLGRDTLTGRRYRIAPAAKFNHHAYRHGLLEHSLDVAHGVDAMSARVGADRDLAVAGALLHDIGKLEAYASDDVIDLTNAGRLLGEIPLGFLRVREELARIDGFPPALGQALTHIVLSHHGRLEYGSPVVPATREATLVHAMDELSGRMGAFDRLARATPDGDAWSRYDRVLETSAFLG